jgi:hypothetical protein
VVPLEDWINTLSFLIPRWDTVNVHKVIHSICLACTSPSHVRSLIDQGILSYWEQVLWRQIKRCDDFDLEGARGRILVAITHLTSIEFQLRSKIPSLCY